MIRYIELDGTILEYELIRKNVKNINLRVYPDGTIHVSASPLLSVKTIDDFLRSNQDFLLRSLARFAAPNRQAVTEAVCFTDGSLFPILGKERKLNITSGKRDRAVLKGECIEVTVTDPQDQESVKKALRLMMEEYSKVLLPQLCQKVADRLASYGITMPSLQFRHMVSRWGSCCPATHTVTFNQLLICAPLPCVEYVVIHELAHFLILDHSPAFHRLMTELLPDWKDRKKQLEPYGRILRIL